MYCPLSLEPPVKSFREGVSMKSLITPFPPKMSQPTTNGRNGARSSVILVPAEQAGQDPSVRQILWVPDQYNSSFCTIKTVIIITSPHFIAFCEHVRICNV